MPSSPKAAPPIASLDRVYGVDFSGAKKAGRTIWVAETCPGRPRKKRPPRLRLISLERLDRLTGHVDRGPALKTLVDLIQTSDDAAWGIDFPFGLPAVLYPAGWDSQVRAVELWNSEAHAFGVHCLEKARSLGGPQHRRRLTDTGQRVPFDPYHYRIIYQTFHGMRDVLGPLRNDVTTCIVPFHRTRIGRADRYVAEACPTTTLHHLGLPHFNYKQPAGGPLIPKRRRARRAILDGLSERVSISSRDRLRMMRDPGADALDAVIAAVGLVRTWDRTDLVAVSRHPDHRREGYMIV